MDSHFEEGFFSGLGFIAACIFCVYAVAGINACHFSPDENQKQEKTINKTTKITLEKK